MATRLTNYVVCVSNDAREASLKEGISVRRLRTVLNGIDLKRFTPTAVSHQKPAVLVARLSPEKDVNTLLQAVEIVIRQQPDFRLQIAGDGSCMAELRRTADRLDLGCVSFLGNVANIPGLLSQSSMFILPSLTEGISLTILEAMASGLPVIATRVGGTPEVVVNDVTGLLVDPRSPESLSKHILELWRNPQRRSEMGRASRARVESLFDIRRTIEDYELLYECGTHGAV
jgi:glycosyltransferase involved in cell wall biosynthesis